MTEPAAGRTDRRPPVVRALAQFLAIVAAFVAAAVLGGWLWVRFWHAPMGVVTLDKDVHGVAHHVWHPVKATDLPRLFSNTGIYVLVAAVLGLVVSIVVTVVFDRLELVTLAGVVVGSSLASVVMLRVGYALGPPEPSTLPVWQRGDPLVSASIHLSGHSPLVVAPAFAMLGLIAVFLTLSRRS